MKMKKKVLCFLLCTILTVGILPFGAFADNVITEISISGYVTPVVGMTAELLTPDTGLPSDADYYVAHEGWWCDTDSEEMEPEAVFEADKSYSYGWTLYADDGMIFDENARVTIDNGSVPTDANYTVRDSEDESVFFVWTTSVEATVPENTILVTGFKAPLEGQTAGDNLASVALADGLPYEIRRVGWGYYDGEEHLLNDTDVFSSEFTYFLAFLVAPVEGTLFGEEVPAVYINGSKELVDDGYTTFAPDKSVVGFVSVGIVPMIPIHEVEIEGYTEPRVGQTPAEVNSSVAAREGAPYEVTGPVWVNESAFALMADESRFTAGMSYFGCFTVIPDEGYAFSENGPEIYINGGTVPYNREYTEVDEGVLYVYTNDITLEIPSDWVKIDKIEVIGYTAPKLGQTALANVASLTVPDGAPYEIDEVIWNGYDDTDDLPLEDKDVFKTGYTYYLFFALTAKEGYYFDLENDTPVQINGSAELWDDDYGAGPMDDGRCRFFTVDVTAEAVTFTYGDVNGDGAVNKKDSLALKKYLADSTNPIVLEAADVNGDGVVNKKDSLRLKQYLAGWDVALGA